MSVYVTRKLFAALMVWGPVLACAAQKPPDKTRHIPKTIWNFEGGVFLQTDGNLSAETCFRLSGRVTAQDFFDNLKRLDDDEGTRFIRGQEAVTEFPEVVKLIFVIHDFPCTTDLKTDVGRQYLTREMMSKLKLSLFWKRGVALRPIDDFKITFAAVKPVPPYATELTSELHEKLEWMYEFIIPSKGVPLTDGLVLIFRREDGHIAARVAARL